MNAYLLKNLKYNLSVNLLDGAFFGFAMGFASFSTVIPLFVSTMTSSALLIGLIPAIHNAGWQLPQLFTAGWVSKQSRYRPLVVSLTFIERLPFLGLGILAAYSARLGVPLTLALTYILLIIQGLGAGLTANPWTTMIGKIIPGERRGTFFGVQAAAANLLASLSAFIAGVLLATLPSPQDFMYCFLLCCVSMGISWAFLSATREPTNQPAAEVHASSGVGMERLKEILARDRNFRWFLVGRMLTQLGVMGFAFYTVYAVRQHGASEIVVGAMTSVMLATQIGANIFMGWAGDRWSRKGVMEFGLAAGVLSSVLAILAPSAAWFYPVYALSAIANVAAWTIGITMSLEFGSEAERPAYIGLANTLIAPVNILAPFLAGWLADLAGYSAAFLAAALSGVAAIVIFHWFVREQTGPTLQAAETSASMTNS